MITDVYIVYDKYIENIGEFLKRDSPSFIYMDESVKKNKKEIYTFKNHWGARALPFVLCMDKDKPVKAFYSEADPDVIKSLINYLNNENSCNL